MATRSVQVVCVSKQDVATQWRDDQKLSIENVGNILEVKTWRPIEPVAPGQHTTVSTIGQY